MLNPGFLKRLILMRWHVFLGVTHRKKRQLIETGTILHLSLPQRVLISRTAFLFWGTVACFWSSYVTQQACTCNVSVRYVDRNSRASERTNPLPWYYSVEGTWRSCLKYFFLQKPIMYTCEFNEGAWSATLPSWPSHHSLNAKILE